MGCRRRFSPTLTTLLLVIISITTMLQPSTCCKPQPHNSKNEASGSSRLMKRGTLRQQLSTYKPPDDAVKTAVFTTKTTLSNSTSNASNSTVDGRPKRQLFRGDIPHHRPLTGNTFAVYSSRWLPLALATGAVEGESKGFESAAASAPIYIPNVDAISEVPPPAHNPSSYQIIQNEIVHEYPVEVSPVISLHQVPQAGHHHHARLLPSHGPRGSPHGRTHAHSHGHGAYAHAAHAPPKVHPDQDPERLRSIGKSNPDAPADLVIKELNGEPGPTGELVKILNGNSNEHSSSAYEESDSGANFENWGSPEYEYRGKPLAHYPSYQTGAQKLAHFLKHWPWFLKSKLFPARYHRKRAPYHYGR